MHKLKYVFLMLFLSYAGFSSVQASHNLAGHIFHQQLPNNTVEITVVTYSDPSAALVDRCTVDLEIWKNNGTVKVTDITNIPRTNGPLNTDPIFPITCPGQGMGQYLFGSIKKNVYTTTYTFAAPGTYDIRFSDLARIDNINNANNTGQQAFYLETSVQVGSSLGPQNSARLLNHQVEFACSGQVWTYNPGGYDMDGDSLVYQFATPIQYDPPSIPSPIPMFGYVAPDTYGSNGPMTIDAQTGLITWNTPVDQGYYVFAVEILAYRNGVFVDKVHFDQMILVNVCMNQPPALQAVSAATVTPGDTLRFDFEFWEPDGGTDSLYLSLNNGGFGLSSAFTASPPATVGLYPSGTLPTAGTDTIRGYVEWATTPALARSAPYQIDLYAHDNIAYHGQTNNALLGRHHVILVYIQAPVGLAEPQEPELACTLSPNPAASFFQIQLDKPQATTVSVYDLEGRLMLQGSGKSAVQTLSTVDLADGLYFVQVEGKSGKAIKKLLVQH